MARTITTTVYHWAELSDDAKRRFWGSGYFDFSSDDGDEFTATLAAFCDAFDASCWGWDVNDYTGPYPSREALDALGTVARICSRYHVRCDVRGYYQATYVTEVSRA